jgi:hypothetical protein
MQGNCIRPGQEGEIPQNGCLGVGGWGAPHLPTPNFQLGREGMAKIQFPRSLMHIVWTKSTVTDKINHPYFHGESSGEHR